MPLALVPNLANMYAICIGFNFSRHQVALLTSLATKMRHLICHIALDCIIGSISWHLH